jgi:hypothetical protein
MSDNEKLSMLQNKVALLDQAINLGLPQDLTIESYGSAGVAMMSIVHFKNEINLFNKQTGLQTLPNAWRAMQYMEYAFALDSQTGGSIFGNTVPSNDSIPEPTRLLLAEMLFNLDILIALQCSHLRAIYGDQSIISFVLEKLNNLAYLKFLPLPASCIELAKCNHRLGDSQKELYWLNQVVAEKEDFADMGVDSHIYLYHKGKKEKAQQFIDATNSNSTENKTGCFIATAAYGSPLASEVIFLSRFRDEVLLNSKIGALFVGFYYCISPPLASFISKAASFRVITRVLLIAPILRLLKSANSNLNFQTRNGDKI